jgi:hypothetical protein
MTEIGKLLDEWKMDGQFDQWGKYYTSKEIDGEHYPELNKFKDDFYRHGDHPLMVTD